MKIKLIINGFLSLDYVSDSNFQSFEPKNKSRLLMYQCQNTNTNVDRF